nr:zeta toxin family protein [Rhabdochromatium marinum]
MEEIRHCFQRDQSFALETTLSGKGYLRQINQWRERGYRVSLYFLSLPNAETAIARVAERVRQGGHHVPEAVIRRRFAAGLHHFHHDYKPQVHTWAHYDNSGLDPLLLEWKEHP